MKSHPILRFTGSLYVIPGYVSILKGYPYHASSCFLLALTSIIAHTIPNETLLLIDQTAMMNYLICSFYIGFAYNVSAKTIGLGVLSVIYSSYIYIVGKKYGTMAWSENVLERIVYHSIMHISTSSVVYFAMNESSADVLE
jgi:hypothetical protein